jgi:hypothetical protein
MLDGVETIPEQIVPEICSVMADLEIYGQFISEEDLDRILKKQDAGHFSYYRHPMFPHCSHFHVQYAEMMRCGTAKGI